MNDASLVPLKPSARPLASASADERILRLRTQPFTEYPRARFLMDLLEERRIRPKSSFKPNVLIWGKSGQGKTTLKDQYILEHQSIFDEASGVRRSPVVAVEMPPLADFRWFLKSLLHAIVAPLPPGRVDLPTVCLRTEDLYHTTGVTQILVDEARNLLMGSGKQQRVVHTAIRYLSNQLGIPLVLFGTAEAREALRMDRQLDRSFQMEELPIWGPGEELQMLAGNILGSLPLRQPSTLTKRALKDLIAQSDGNTAHMFQIFTDLAVAAIENRTECIRPEDVSERCSK